MKSSLSPLLTMSWARVWNGFLSLTHNITYLKPQLEFLEINKTLLVFSNRGKSYLWRFGQFLPKSWSQQRSKRTGHWQSNRYQWDWRGLEVHSDTNLWLDWGHLYANGKKREAPCRAKCQCWRYCRKQGYVARSGTAALWGRTAAAVLLLCPCSQAGCTRKASPVEPSPAVLGYRTTLRKPASWDGLEEDEKFSSQVIWLKYSLFDVLPYWTW